MIFVNLGDGYSSGCCTGSKYFYAGEDPKYAGQMSVEIEHPDSRDGSFINQLATIYRAQTLTFAKHRCPIEFFIDTLDEIQAVVKQYNDDIVYFVGVNNLRSRLVNDEYLMLDGLDNTILEQDKYFELCNEDYDPKPKIKQIEKFLRRISKSANRIILYRTDADPFKIKVPKNCSIVPDSVVETLASSHAYRRGYYDKHTYKKFTMNLLKYFI
tara:strand:- start:1186 stop:1824 length:639 start_codon:yes stop_codon:yes gene_type:complete